MTWARPGSERAEAMIRLLPMRAILPGAHDGGRPEDVQLETPLAPYPATTVPPWRPRRHAKPVGPEGSKHNPKTE